MTNSRAAGEPHCYLYTMTKLWENGAKEPARTPGKDTIEMELRAEDALGLARSAAEHLPGDDAEQSIAEAATSAREPSGQDASAAGGGRLRPLPILLGAAGIISFAAAAIALYRPAGDELPAPTTVAVLRDPPPSSLPPATEESDPAPEPVQFRNPFDRSEVFVFPPGTSEADARAAVAEALIERARERQIRRKTHGTRGRGNSPDQLSKAQP